MYCRVGHAGPLAQRADNIGITVRAVTYSATATLTKATLEMPLDETAPMTITIAPNAVIDASLRHSALIVVALTFLGGCHSMRSTPAATLTDGGRTLFITVDGGRRRLTLERVTVTADSIVGFVSRIEVLPGGAAAWQPARPHPPRGQRTAIARADVVSIQFRQLHVARTVGIVAALSAVGLYVAVILTLLLAEPLQ